MSQINYSDLTHEERTILLAYRISSPEMRATMELVLKGYDPEEAKRMAQAQSQSQQ